MVRNYMLGEMCRSYESPFSLADAWIFIATSGLDDQYFSCSLQAVNEVTPQEIQELAQRYLCKETLKEVIAGKSCHNLLSGMALLGEKLYLCPNCNFNE